MAAAMQRENQDSSNSHNWETRDEYEIYLAERKWVFRCRNAAVIVLTGWLVWIVAVQIVAVGLLPHFLYVRRPDQGEYTGW